MGSSVQLDEIFRECYVWFQILLNRLEFHKKLRKMLRILSDSVMITEKMFSTTLDFRPMANKT